jgi:hypothetical protein
MGASNSQTVGKPIRRQKMPRDDVDDEEMHKILMETLGWSDIEVKEFTAKTKKTPQEIKQEEDDEVQRMVDEAMAHATSEKPSSESSSSDSSNTSSESSDSSNTESNPSESTSTLAQVPEHCRNIFCKDEVDCTYKDGKSVFGKLALKTHPDKNPDRDTTVEFRDLLSCWELFKKAKPPTDS